MEELRPDCIYRKEGNNVKPRQSFRFCETRDVVPGETTLLMWIKEQSKSLTFWQSLPEWIKVLVGPCEWTEKGEKSDGLDGGR